MSNIRYRDGQGKRLFDVIVVGLSCVVTVPLLLLVALAVRVKLGAPVLFKQVRPGLYGRPFTLYKFRTMQTVFGEDGEPLSDEARLTSFGRSLRSTSLDELPALWNVIRGEMSLIGPRPLLMEYLPLYNREQMKRHNVLPGVTGLAQVHGRNALSWKEKFDLDLQYVRACSLRLDVAILLKTVLKVVAREGISQVGRVTADPFTGSEGE